MPWLVSTTPLRMELRNKANLYKYGKEIKDET